MVAILLVLAVLFLAGPSPVQANHAYAAKTKKPCIGCHVQVSGGGGINATGKKFRENGHSLDEKKAPRETQPKDEDEEGGGGGGGGGSSSDEDEGSDEGSSGDGDSGGGGDSGGDGDSGDSGDSGGGGDSGGDSGDTAPPPDRPDSPEETAQRARVLAEAEAQMKSAGDARRRESLAEAADLGRKLFATPNPKLTRSNKSCAGCHQMPDLATRAARYPTFHDGLDRVVNLDTAIRFCILKQMDGPSVKPGSKVPVALEMYLKQAK